MNRRPKATTGPFSVSSDPARGYPTAGAALSVAQNRVVRGPADVLDVLEHGRPLYRVERRGRSVLTTYHEKETA